MGHWHFPIQKCIRGTKHLTIHPSPSPTQTMLTPWSQNAPCRFQHWLGEGGGVGERKIFFRVFAFLRWWHYLVWMCSVPRTFGQDCLSIGMYTRNRCMKNCVSVKPDKHFITDKRFARYNSLWALLCTIHSREQGRWYCNFLCSWVGVRETRNRCMKNCVGVKPNKHFITDKRFARNNSLWALLCTIHSRQQGKRNALNERQCLYV